MGPQPWEALRSLKQVRGLREQRCVWSRSLTINKPGSGLSLWAQCHPESPQCLSLKQSGKKRTALSPETDTLKRAESPAPFLI